MTTASKAAPAAASITSDVLARFIQIAFVFALQAVILFAGAGRLDWLWAWVYLGSFAASVAINAALLLRTNLEIVVERGRAIGHMRRWDRLVSGLWAACQYLALPLIAGLDIRFAWTGEVSPIVQVAGAVVLASGLGLFSWAMIVNAYFSTAAQVQPGQMVCRVGPYRFVRHPGYAGAILQSVGAALLLGSWWAVIPGVAAGVCMVIRTVLEDRMLRSELPGYSDYAREVPFRLVPRYW